MVGVAENVRSGHLGSDDPETVYLPYGLYAVSELSLLVRSNGDPAALTESIRGAVRNVDPDMTVFNARVMEAFVTDATAPERFSVDLLTAFGATGLALALIGLYGVLSHLVSLRRREPRSSDGARCPLGDVRRLVLGHGVRLIALGVVVGVVVASALSRLLVARAS